MNTLTEKINELNQNYNDLGEDLVLLEALLDASQRENIFPSDCIESATARMTIYIAQHTGEINHLTHSIAMHLTPRPRSPLQGPSL